ncbi:MAG: DUF2489 domain-containing protein [Amphritea sp.]
MSQTTLYILITINLVIISGLLVYLYRFVKAQKLKKTKAAEQLEELAKQAKEQRLYLIESLQVIAQCLMNSEIPLTEGCIRCKVLIDNLDSQLGQSGPFTVFNEVYEQSKHIPKLDAWKQLKTKDKLKYMDEMDKLEAQYRDAIMVAAEGLKRYQFDRYH